MQRSDNSNKLIKYIVVLGDFVILNILFYIYTELDARYVGVGPLHRLDEAFLIVNMAMAISQTQFATHLHERLITSDKIMQRVFGLVACHALLSYVLYKPFVYGPPVGKFTLVFDIILFVVLLGVRLLERLALKRFRLMGRNKRFVLFVGSDPALLSIYTGLSKDPSMGYVIKGYVADEDIPDCPPELKRIGTIQDLQSRMEDKSNKPLGVIDELFCCFSSDDADLIRQIARFCDNHIIRFYFIQRSIDRLGMHLKVENLAGNFVFTNHEEPLSLLSNRIVKRTMDLAVAIPVCLCLLPLIPILALIIKIQSPGPIFFRQLRTGIGGQEFYCYKFRSMHVNKDADLVQATKDDPRKFAFGNFMRKTNIDELPQFFNVLTGQMSVVGPRPHMLHHTEVYSELIDKYMVRHYVKPGITGWAQVTGFRGETKELWQMQGRVERDIWYIENWTPWLDIRIIWLTFKQLFVHDEHAY